MINLKKSEFDLLISTLVGAIILILALTILTRSCTNTGENIPANASNSMTTENTVPPTETTTEETTSESVAMVPETTINPKDLIDFDADHPYLIKVNRDENFTTIYGIDENGEYTIPYKTFVCSTGLIPENTPLGEFKTSDMYRWRLMVDDTYAQYAIRINGQIMLHSVPYEEPKNDTLEYWEYNKLGEPASLGCVRFRVSAIKWIYDNCNVGTTVIIYSEPGEVPPIPLKRIKKIKGSNPKSNWDPTDPDIENPWKN